MGSCSSYDLLDDEQVSPEKFVEIFYGYKKFRKCWTNVKECTFLMLGPFQIVMMIHNERGRNDIFARCRTEPEFDEMIYSTSGREKKVKFISGYHFHYNRHTLIIYPNAFYLFREREILCSHTIMINFNFYKLYGKRKLYLPGGFNKTFDPLTGNDCWVGFRGYEAFYIFPNGLCRRDYGVGTNVKPINENVKLIYLDLQNSVFYDPKKSELIIEKKFSSEKISLEPKTIPNSNQYIKIFFKDGSLEAEKNYLHSLNSDFLNHQLEDGDIYIPFYRVREFSKMTPRMAHFLGCGILCNRLIQKSQKLKVKHYLRANKK